VNIVCLVIISWVTCGAAFALTIGRLLRLTHKRPAAGLKGPRTPPTRPAPQPGPRHVAASTRRTIKRTDTAACGCEATTWLTHPRRIEQHPCPEHTFDLNDWEDRYAQS
jgi:hypothetical protein